MFAARNGLKVVAKPAVARVMSSNAGQLPTSEKLNLVNKEYLNAVGDAEDITGILPTPWDYMFKAPRPEGVTIFNDRRFVPSSSTMQKLHNPDRFITETREPLTRLQDSICSRTHPDGNWTLRAIFGFPLNGERSTKHKMAKLLAAEHH